MKLERKWEINRENILGRETSSINNAAQSKELYY